MEKKWVCARGNVYEIVVVVVVRHDEKGKMLSFRIRLYPYSGFVYEMYTDVQTEHYLLFKNEIG